MKPPDRRRVRTSAAADPVDVRLRTWIERRAGHVDVPPVRYWKYLARAQRLVEDGTRLRRQDGRGRCRGDAREDLPDLHHVSGSPTIHAARIARAAMRSPGGRRKDLLVE